MLVECNAATGCHLNAGSTAQVVFSFMWNPCRGNLTIQVLALSQVEELHFSLAKGRWSQAWGSPPLSVPSGASVRAWQPPSSTEEQQRRHFRDLVHVRRPQILQPHSSNNLSMDWRV